MSKRNLVRILRGHDKVWILGKDSYQTKFSLNLVWTWPYFDKIMHEHTEFYKN